MHHKKEEIEFYSNSENYYKMRKLLLALEDGDVPSFYKKELFFSLDFSRETRSSWELIEFKLDTKDLNKTLGFLLELTGTRTFKIDSCYNPFSVLLCSRVFFCSLSFTTQTST